MVCYDTRTGTRGSVRDMRGGRERKTVKRHNDGPAEYFLPSSDKKQTPWCWVVISSRTCARVVGASCARGRGKECRTACARLGCILRVFFESNESGRSLSPSSVCAPKWSYGIAVSIYGTERALGSSGPVAYAAGAFTECSLPGNAGAHLSASCNISKTQNLRTIKVERIRLSYCTTSTRSWSIETSARATWSRLTKVRIS